MSLDLHYQKSNDYVNVPLPIVLPSIILILIGIVSMVSPLRVVYADDSSDQSQTDQSSSSSDESSSQKDDSSSDQSQTDQSLPSSSDKSQIDHSSSSQQCPPGQFVRHNFCITEEQKKKSEEFSNCLGGSALSAAKGAVTGDPSGTASGVGGLLGCFRGVK
jgi:cytoskeletal protein RodZ